MSQEVQEQLATRIETLLQELAALPDPHARATAEELVQSLVSMYGEGLARLLEITAASGASGLALIDAFARDDLLSSLFVLHGLHPLDIEARVLQALDQIRSSLKSQGATLEFVRFTDGIASVRLQTTGQSCSVSLTTLKSAIEEALYAAVPDLEGLVVEGGNTSSRSAIPVTFVPPRRRKTSVAG